jgi:N-acetylglucosamine-6-phosphate deacetylase
VEVVNGRLQLADGTLAGANITMLDAVRYLHRSLGLELEKCLELASAGPARVVERQDAERKQGRLVPGYRANLVHLSPDLDVVATWIDGESF